jgi:inner membrane protein
VASAITHGLVALALVPGMVPREGRWRLAALGALSSIMPDVDVVGFRLGIAYGDFLGHRGFSHSLLFAVLWSAALSYGLLRAERWGVVRHRVMLYLTVCTASHGVFDAMTNGGLGVAFLSPFDMTRYFFPFRPVSVSPLTVGAFFSGRGWRILGSELVWIGLPTAVVAFILYVRVVAARARASMDDEVT